VAMVACPHESMQNHSPANQEVKMQINSWGRRMPLLRVAASSNQYFQRTVKKLRFLPSAED
ncbi:hypothetical protein LLG90_25860, partial [Aromatoleum toluclasticum]|uniref:hypothetical protein n=1 Tax=Aromatoleum toluclasticum TaxID=92003 RepID=UPI001D183ECC